MLQDIQFELKAPKSQQNNFGGFNYRSCEDILEALKPLLKKYSAYVTLQDEIIVLQDRFYVKATATYKDKDGEVSVSAYAREPLAKKGMDEAQITGATSSYARKYALNGLFAIDDTKDSDYYDNSQENKPKAQKFLSVDELSDLSALIEATGTDLDKFLKFFNIKELNEAPYQKAKNMLLKKINAKGIKDESH